ncbi:hypothetical protein M0R72_03560 [Candidatus Pacearchaeota archaeon]|jgi:hypothetical protein|nr:hypothetical protein [Candidatus Pacearchaeota archaeon]
MKRGIISIALLIFLCSFISAEIIFTEPLETIYNLGEVINVPVTIKTVSDASGVFQMDLICNGTKINFYKYSGIQLSAGEEKKIESSLLLIRNIIGNEKGNCRIKAILGGEYSLTDEFKISDSLIIGSAITQTEFNPEETISISGTVTKENLEKSNGFIQARIISDNEEVVKDGTISNGEFELDLTIPSKIEAGNYILRLTATEKDSDGIITNNGIKDFEIKIKQKPNNLELILEDTEFLPEEFVKIKAILHDQTGESIASSVYITIKNSDNKIIEQKEINTGEFLEYEIIQGELPSEWKIYAVSNKLSTEKEFSILEKESADISIINRTLYAENTGNIFYNKTLLIKIDNKSLNLEIKLKVGESKKYILNAPDGEYTIKISSEEHGEISELVSLTGNAIGVKELFNYNSLNIYMWILLIFVLFMVMLVSWNKVYKKNFFERIKIRNREKKEKETPVIGSGDSKRGSTAEISLSIKEGDKQEASFICVKIKNIKDTKAKRGSGYETIEKLRELGEEHKATIYEDKDYLFFILAPAKTRTFKNEKTALELAEKIQEILIDHNRRFSEKINYGISLDTGSIIAKIENGIFKFMSMGPLVTSSRKIASLSNENILLSEKMNELLRLIAKTEKEIIDGTNIYRLTKVKKENEEAKKFISKFMERQKRD